MATRYQALIQERTDLVAEGRALFEAAEQANRELTDEERTRDDAINARLGLIAGELEREERRRERERTVEALPDNGAPPPNGNGTWTAGRDRAADRPWASLGEFLQAVARFQSPGGVADPRLFRAEVSGASSGVPSDGGFLVGSDFSRMLLDRGQEAAVLAPLCATVEIGANSDGLEAPYIDETSRATGSRWGGVQVYRRAEADTVTASRPKFAMFDLRLEDLMAIAYATERLLNDATALESVFTDAFTSEFAWRLDNEILRGSGAGECLGVLTSGALVTVSKETGQPAASIVAENIFKMRARLVARSRPRSRWLINQDIEPELATMALSIGTGGVPVYLPAGGLSSDGYDRLYGRPVIPIEQASALGTVGDLSLVDLSEYVLIRKGGIQDAQSIHVRFLYNERTFRWVYRINGAPKWRTALTPANGTDTKSPFVTLATRA